MYSSLTYIVIPKAQTSVSLVCLYWSSPSLRNSTASQGIDPFMESVVVRQSELCEATIMRDIPKSHIWGVPDGDMRMLSYEVHSSASNIQEDIDAHRFNIRVHDT